MNVIWEKVKQRVIGANAVGVMNLSKDLVENFFETCNKIFVMTDSEWNYDPLKPWRFNTQ